MNLSQTIRHAAADRVAAHRRPRVLPVLMWAYVVWSLVPVAIAVLFSFNDGRSRTLWQGFSLRWWTGDPNASLLHDESLRTATINSLVLAALTIIITLPLGTALAVGTYRWRSRGSTSANSLVTAPVITPELVVGASLLLVFTHLYAMIPLGLPAQLLGHITFNLSAVVVTIRARLAMIGGSYEEAARDLGASRMQAVRFVLLPLLQPAIVASVVIVFATSIDDFVISSFLSTGAASETVPVRIYGAVRSASSPSLNALATLLVLISITALFLGIVALWAIRRRQGENVSLRSVLAEVTQADA